jgi:hypothetical protein
VIFGVFESWAQLIDVLGNWLGALATFLAAYFALHIANHGNIQRLTVNARPMTSIVPGVHGSDADVFLFSATNVGQRPITIKVLALKSRVPTYNAFLIEGMQGSSPIPVTLKDGESASWIYPEILPDGRNWYRQFAEHMKKRNRFVQWLQIRNIRFYVSTSLGADFYAPASPEFQRKVREQLEEARKLQCPN